MDYDLILDCTDNPATRYLISDVAIALGKPLVTGAASRTEGQLMVLNFPPTPAGCEWGGPCYRCVFPKPPAPETVISCDEAGILGPVVGVIGVLQASEAIKVLVQPWPAPSKSAEDLRDWKIRRGMQAEEEIPYSMLVFSAFLPRQFRSVALCKGRRDGCLCRTDLTMAQILEHDYDEFCGRPRPTEALDKSLQKTPTMSFQTLSKFERTILLDVREKAHFDAYHFPGSVNVPYSKICAWKKLEDIPKALQTPDMIFVVCRQGNDSQDAVRKLKDLRVPRVFDVKGGFDAWRKDVDTTWPRY